MENINAIYSELNLLFANFQADFVVQNGEFSVSRLTMVCDKYNKSQFLEAITDIDYNRMENVAKHYDEVDSILSSSLRRAILFIQERRENYFKSIDPSELLTFLYDEKKHKIIHALTNLVKSRDDYTQIIVEHKQVADKNNSDMEMNNTVKQILAQHTTDDIRHWLDSSPYLVVKPYFDHYQMGECREVFTYSGFVEGLLEQTISSLQK